MKKFIKILLVIAMLVVGCLAGCDCSCGNKEEPTKDPVTSGYQIAFDLTWGTEGDEVGTFKIGGKESLEIVHIDFNGTLGDKLPALPTAEENVYFFNELDGEVYNWYFVNADGKEVKVESNTIFNTELTGKITGNKITLKIKHDINWSERV